MKFVMKKGASLHLKLLLSVAAVMVVTLAAAFLLINGLKTSFDEVHNRSNMAALDVIRSQNDMQNQTHPSVSRLKWQIVSGAVIIVLMLAGIGLFIDRWVLQRINRMASAAALIAQGQFHSLVPVTIKDEIGLLGENVNDIAMNTQESLLYMWNMSNRMAGLLKQGLEDAGSRQSSAGLVDAAQVEKINELLQEMRSTIQTFGLFGVVINQEKLITSPVTVDCECEQTNQQDRMLDGSFPLQRKVGSFPG